MRRVWILVLVAQGWLPAAWGWGAEVHRAITYLALDGLPAEAPAWLRDPAVRRKAAFEANQPDRWRGWDSAVLKHENDPEHYLDADVLDQFGLTLETVPRLRYEYLRALAIAKHTHPEQVEPYNAGKDEAHTKEWPGFVLHAVAEHYARLQAALNQVRILEQLNDPARQDQLEQARARALACLGDLSHFAGDIAQPLHTTKHHHAWVGANPAAYVWRERLHSFIDSGWAEEHKVSEATLRPRIKYGVKVNAKDPWEDVLGYFRRSHAEVERLYTLERDKKLEGAEAKQLLEERLDDAASTLSALIWAAYTSAEPTKKQVDSWVRYEGRDTGSQAPETQPASAPAEGD